LLQIEENNIKINEMGKIFIRNIASSFDNYFNKNEELKLFSKSI
jgi:coproporphyrinogen III oxidase-like Fe-S oxidoreductase